ncbi:ABC transporter ATP-binding protein [Acidisoma cellulosilytica]|uniref:ABC transporter ATP-binding protein n=1 Tax=Acidisoma cellulosilyticum TaxID=2802395 RepID=A0A963Z7F9_9PROT|nr:ABC transporter ATP-binding protein [Acidisoma cellulosilyticum]MCB8883899.1 ABC transporter ATP-binding protein [Acidisoma cellulosilyticum]
MITFKNVTKRYDNSTIAVDNLSLEAPKGKITIFVGPSGCGKTTSLRMINRLITPSSGTIMLDGQPTEAIDLARLRRKIGYVIQHAGLFPHLTVVQNIATTARLIGIAKKQALGIASELIERVGLDRTFANRYPWQLSGGQQQRVGVARALASDPEFMLMDEPFSAVDPVVRHQLQEEFLRLQRDIGKTIIMVTHDIDEALKLGDQVAVLRTGGILAQIASPQELLSKPADAFVADFVGRDRGYRYLGFVDATSSLAVAAEPAAPLGTEPSTARALTRDRWILVTNAAAQPMGWVDLDQQTGPIRESDLNLSGTLASQSGNLRQVLDAALSAPSGRGVIVGTSGALLGSVRLAEIVTAIESAKAVGMGARS